MPSLPRRLHFRAYICVSVLYGLSFVIFLQEDPQLLCTALPLLYTCFNLILLTLLIVMMSLVY